MHTKKNLFFQTPKPQTPVKTEDIHIQSPSPEVAAVAAVAAVGAAAATKSAPKVSAKN